VKDNVHPAVIGTVIAIIVVIIAVFGYKMLTADSPTNPVVVKPANPNDPKFTEHLPKGLAGTGSANSKD